MYEFNVPDPEIQNPRDAIIRITRTAICGSDLHLYDGYIPSMKKGDVLGHEFMGEVVEVGHENGLKRGDRVVVPFAIACGQCWFCKQTLTSLCDNSNPNAALADAAYGFSGSGLFGYSHMLGGFAGGQARIRARSVFRFRAFESAGELIGRASVVPDRHFPYGLHGGRELQHHAGDIGGDLGLRARGPVRDPQRVSAGRGTSDCDRPGSGAAGDGAQGKRGNGRTTRKWKTWSNSSRF